MNSLLALSRGIDRMNEIIGKAVGWLILAAILVSATNAIIRKAFNTSSNAWLELQWYLFGAVFMLGAAYALSKGAHVRTDMLWENFSDRTKGMIDAGGYILFFLPTMIVLFWISIDDFFYSMSINERSNTTSWQPILWPLRGVIPLACLLFSSRASPS